MIGGSFPANSIFNRKNLARLNSDGSIDVSFSPQVNNTVFTILLQPDGKIIIGGDFSNINGTILYHLARLNPNGTLDTGFMDQGDGTDNRILSAALQPDGKIVIAGHFVTYNNVNRLRVARVNTDGTLDNTFNNSGGGITGTSTLILASEVILQPDGKIILAGLFTGYNSTSRNNIVRITSNGNLDNSFNPGIGTNLMISAVRLQSDGKIIIGGSFTSYNSIAINRLARLNTNGSLDTSFDTGSGADVSILTMALQSNGKIIIGGFFSNYNGTAINKVARVNGELISASNNNLPELQSTVYPNPFSTNITIQLPTLITDKAQVTLQDMTGRIIYNQLFQLDNQSESLNIDVSNVLKSGIYYLQIETDNKVYCSKVIKQ